MEAKVTTASGTGKVIEPYYEFSCNSISEKDYEDIREMLAGQTEFTVLEHVKLAPLLARCSTTSFCAITDSDKLPEIERKTVMVALGRLLKKGVQMKPSGFILCEECWNIVNGKYNTPEKELWLSAVISVTRALLDPNDRAVPDMEYLLLELGKIKIVSLSPTEVSDFNAVKKFCNDIFKSKKFRWALRQFYLLLGRDPSEIDELIEKSVTYLQSKVQYVFMDSSSMLLGLCGFYSKIYIDKYLVFSGDTGVRELLVFVICHEMSHQLVRNVINQNYLKVTPPKEGGPEEIRNLEAGFTFVLLLFGSYKKKLWLLDECKAKMWKKEETWAEEGPMMTPEEIAKAKDLPINSPNFSSCWTKPRPPLFM